MVIFKGKRELKFPVPRHWIVCVQEKGWMDEQLMIRWIKEIYLKHTQKERSLCVLDSFRGHLTDSVKKEFRKGNGVMAVIPGGCTSKVQPLDVCINKPFKGELRKSWVSYMKSASKEARDAGERVKCATKEQVVQWLSEAVSWLQQKPELVVKSFKVCGISNDLAGNEADLIRNDSHVPDCEYESDSEESFEGFEPDDLARALEKLDGSQ